MTAVASEVDRAEPRTVPEMFRRRLAADADAVFLQLADGSAWTFADLDRLAEDLRARLVAGGVGPGDTVGLYQWNEPSWFVTVLAAWRLGAVAALCGAVSPAGEATRRFEMVRPTMIVASDAPDLAGRWPVVQVDAAGQVLAQTPPAGGGPRTPPARGEPGAPPILEPSVDDPACIFFTSGTTGESKALVKSHGNIAGAPRRTAEAYSRSGAFRPRMAGAGKPPALSFNPFGQSASFGRLMFRLYIGRPLIMIRKFDVETVKQLADRYRLDTLQLTPAMVHMLAHTDLEIDLSSLQYVNSGTAPLPVATREAFEKRYGVPVLQAYGSTEGGVTALERYEDVMAGRRGTGSVGRITPESEWRIVDPDGRDVPVGQEGEILGRPDQQTMLTEDGESRLPLDEDGWYHTGDVGRVDEHGILYLTGRLKEMMIVGGFNVFPAEVEDALRAIPLVRDAVVVSLPDERLGEIPVAGIVWDPAAGPDETDRMRRLAADLRERLAAYKVPRRWFSLAEVPLTPNGKVDRMDAARTAAVESRDTTELGAQQGGQ